MGASDGGRAGWSKRREQESVRERGEGGREGRRERRKGGERRRGDGD
jgi:hypothetical protein